MNYFTISHAIIENFSTFQPQLFAYFVKTHYLHLITGTFGFSGGRW